MSSRGDTFVPQKWRGLLSHIPVFPGRLRIVDCVAGVASHLRGKEHSVALWKSAQFHVDLHDRIQRQMWLGCYEPHIMRSISAILGVGSTFLDIGANIGYHAYFGAGLVGPSGTVYAFEPDPQNFAVLARNLASFPWATPENAAVWDRTTPLEFERSFYAGESGWGMLTAVRDSGKGDKVSVPAVSLDEWSKSVSLGSLDLIKLDAEGAELHVLQGGQSLIQRFYPTICLEINVPHLIQSGSSSMNLIATLQQLDYAVFVLENRRIFPYTSIPDHHVVDCICLNRNHCEALLHKLRSKGFQVSR